MHQSIINLTTIDKQINDKISDETNIKKVNIVAVSKTFKIIDIEPMIKFGHTHFGENKVQEALDKWSDIKVNNKNIRLHLIGKLQTNKVKFVLPLFDYIHSLDSTKLAEKISNEQSKKNFRPKIFVQVNIANETQKNGIEVKSLETFLKFCEENCDLDILGLMCIPPIDKDPEVYFKEMNLLNKKFGFKDLSMGMSNDFISAINNGATYIRVGSKIFGKRTI
tara:strand:- start:88 stop:753 length:666 start_codon:yes stop_codon:yes gene_type:complete